MKNRINTFINSSRNYPLLAGFICGLYALLFFYSNNFAAVFSFQHLIYFIGIFIVAGMLVLQLIYSLAKRITAHTMYQTQILCVSIVVLFSGLLSFAMFLTFKKKLILIVVIITLIAVKKGYYNYKKLLVMVMLITTVPLATCVIHSIEHINALAWTIPDKADTILDIRLKETPNIYVIQPDGYVAKPTLNAKPYTYTSDLYLWLQHNNFKVYDNFRSNYPASLVSNASMFAMQHHRFKSMIYPSLELPKARQSITGISNVSTILKANNYTMACIAQDEYFQQTKHKFTYDYTNITNNEIPYISKGDNVVKNVFSDLKHAMALPTHQPKFYFIEKLMPHHIHFKPKFKDNRDYYTRRIDSVNTWLKTTLSYIDQNDPKALVVVLADHGGWLGNTSYADMYSANDAVKQNSVFSVLAAIKWNGYLKDNTDDHLQSSVNLFRVIFSVLAENTSVLKHLKDNSSYNLTTNAYFGKNVIQVFNNKGEFSYNNAF